MENEKIYELMQKMYEDLKTGQEQLQNGQNQLKNDLLEIKEKLTAVFDQTANLTEFRTETKDSLLSLSKDVKFIKHKLHETEEDVFDIKDHLKIVK